MTSNTAVFAGFRANQSLAANKTTRLAVRSKNYGLTPNSLLKLITAMKNSKAGNAAERKTQRSVTSLV